MTPKKARAMRQLYEQNTDNDLICWIVRGKFTSEEREFLLSLLNRYYHVLIDDYYFSGMYNYIPEETPEECLAFHVPHGINAPDCIYFVNVCTMEVSYKDGSLPTEYDQSKIKANIDYMLSIKNGGANEK